MIFRDSAGNEYRAEDSGVSLNGEPLYRIGASLKPKGVIERKPKQPKNPPFVSRVITPLIKPMG